MLTKSLGTASIQEWDLIIQRDREEKEREWETGRQRERQRDR